MKDAYCSIIHCGIKIFVRVLFVDFFYWRSPVLKSIRGFRLKLSCRKLFMYFCGGLPYLSPCRRPLQTPPELALRQTAPWCLALCACLSHSRRPSLRLGCFFYCYLDRRQLQYCAGCFSDCCRFAGSSSCSSSVVWRSRWRDSTSCRVRTRACSPGQGTPRRTETGK